MISQSPRLADIRRFIYVLAFGVLSAVAAVAVLAYLYGPSGQYIADRVLLSPKALSEGEFQETPPGSRTPQRFTLDRIEYTYFDAALAKWVSAKISLETYEKFFASVAQDKSMPPSDEALASSFADSHPSRLTIWLRSNDPQLKERPVQEVMFALRGDFFRVELRSGQWVYFRHPAIYEQTFDLFSGKR
jgi:hypothetical protein